MLFSHLNAQSDDSSRSTVPAPATTRGSAAEALPLDTAILIVEDEVLIAWTLDDLLTDLGFRDVRVARDSEEAVSLAQERLPGLLICDVNLGKGDDGVATAARIRALAWVPALFITGYAGDEIRARIDQYIAGAPLLRKPIEPQPLQRILRQVFKQERPH